MSTDLTVVVSCAGTGSRLGMGTTKALVEIHGRPLISWQLALLERVSDVRVVVGYEAKRVIDTVKAIRPDALFVLNHDFRQTGTAASVSLALRGINAGNDVISLDGDLLVHPEHFEKFLHLQGPRLGLVEPISSDPVFALLDQEKRQVVQFSRERTSASALEWSGLCRLPAEALLKSVSEGVHRRHVYEMLAPRLPIPFDMIDAQEIDTSEDLSRAATWLNIKQSIWPNGTGV